MKTNRFLMIVLMFLVFGIGIFILTEIQNSTSVGLLELNNGRIRPTMLGQNFLNDLLQIFLRNDKP